MIVPVRCRPFLILLVCLFFAARLQSQQVSCAVQTPPTTPAAQSFAQRDYPKAFDLYTLDVKSNPNSFDAIAGQVRSQLKQQQVSAAADIAESAVAAHAKSAVLATVLGEVRFRQGRLSDAIKEYQISLALDPCLARTRYDAYRLLWARSMRASGYSQLQAAHQLEPEDPDIRLAWIERLPLVQRSHAIDGYLTTSRNNSDHQDQSLKEYADQLRAILAGRDGTCHLVGSSATTTTLPFQFLMADAYRFNGVGFDVTVNNKAKALLELDTGASGILLNRGTARKAGLVPVTTAILGGIGDQQDTNGYWAFADDLHVGKLEFKNCLVEVSDKRSIVNTDGLIGADVFENYQVQLDFPLRQMTLSSLPLRPGELPAEKGALNAARVGSAATEASKSAPEKGSEAPVSQPTIHYTDRYVSSEMQTWSPFTRFGHQILIDGYLKDKSPRLFLLDSGSNVSVLSVPAAKSVGKVHFDGDDQITGLSGKVKKVYTANNVDLVFAGLRDPLPEVLVMSLDGLSKDNGTELSGIVGLDTMMMLTVDIDYRDGLIHLGYDPKHGTNVRLR